MIHKSERRNSSFELEAAIYLGTVYICSAYCVLYVTILVNSQSITQMNSVGGLYSLPGFFAFSATHIKQMKTFSFAEAVVRIAHCHLCVNLYVHNMC